MEKFNKNIITQKEKYSIEKWTQDSSEIKKTMWGISDNKIALEHSKRLFSLFDKYSSNVAKGVVLYRGMSIPDELFYGMGYDNLVKGSRYTPDDKAITSFTKSKKIAYDFVLDGEFKNNIILKIESHEDNILDISEISTVAKEEETILMKNIWYNVKYIKRIMNGGVKWLLIVLQKK